MKDFRPDRRGFVSGALGVVAAAAWPARADQRLILNDASRLNPTPIARHVRPKSDAKGAYIDALRAELKDAASAGRRVAVGAARHSMGGQSLPRDGTAITFDDPCFEVDSQRGVYRVAAGARWADVIANLDPLGFSPKVMQSNNDFGVASTFCVNAHGWPVPFAVELKGTFDTPAGGSVTFTLGSDYDAWVFVNGNLVVDNDGIHALATAPTTVSGLLPGTNTLDAFFADRHIVQAALVFDANVTTVAELGVPETSTWAMMLAGFASLGFAAFRRSRNTGIAIA